MPEIFQGRREDEKVVEDLKKLLLSKDGTVSRLEVPLFVRCILTQFAGVLDILGGLARE